MTRAERIRQEAEQERQRAANGKTDPPPPANEPPSSKLVSTGAALEQLVELGKLPVYTTPFPSVNDAIGFGGMLATQCYSLPGGTGRGKTSFVTTLARHHAKTGDALIATWEMVPGYYLARTAASALRVKSNMLIREAGQRAREILDSIPQRIYWLNKPTLGDLRVEVDRLAQRSGVAPLLVVDYLQKVAAQLMRDMKHPDPRSANMQASESIMAIAEDKRCPALVVNATSRANGRRTQDARSVAPYELVDVAAESGAIEFDSAATIVLSLTDRYEDDEQVGTITCAKTRYGTECHIDARYNGALGEWRDLGRIQRGDIRLRGQIMEALATPAKSKNEIVERVGSRKQAVLREVDAMLELKLIVRGAEGYSRSPDWSPL